MIETGTVADKLSLARAEQALAQGDALGALALIDRALSVAPDDPQILVGRARALRGLARAHEALACCDTALQSHPQCAEAHAERALCHHELGDDDAACHDWQAALALQPQRADWLLRFATLLSDANRLEAAIAMIDRAEAAHAAVDDVHFLRAALGVAVPPSAPPAGYVEALFDGYASRFERHLTRRLRYRAPQLLANALLPLLGGQRLRVVDLGCGTGLMGALVRDHASQLDGVDLSAAMIERARGKRIFDRLQVGDLVAFLQEAPERYDLAVAADVFCYLGDLAPVFQALRHALAGGGFLAFSVEALEEGEFRLQPTRRFAHARRYIEDLARAQGFAARGITRRVLRRNGENDVWGYVAVFQRQERRR